MRLKRVLRLVPFFLSLSSCVWQAEPPAPPGEFVRPLEFGGRLILPGGELLDKRDTGYFFQKADYVLIGESHDNPTDHASQAAILQMLIQERHSPVLGLEMLDDEAQSVLDRFNSGSFGVENLEDLAQELDWNKTGLAFDLYRPLFELAVRTGTPIHALNIPRRVVRAARLRGLSGLTAEEKKYVPAYFMEASWPQQIHLRQFFDNHLARGAPENQVGAAGRSLTQEERSKAVQGYILAQALWDSVMAERAKRVHDKIGRPVVIIAGVGHVEYGWGIAMRLRAIDPSARIISIMPWRSSMEDILISKDMASMLSSPAKKPGASEQTFPPANLGDAYYYSPSSPVAKHRGLATAQRGVEGRTRLEVTGVDAGSPAEQAGLQAGDVIISLGMRRVSNNEELHYILAQFEAYASPAELKVRRSSETLTLVLPPP